MKHLFFILAVFLFASCSKESATETPSSTIVLPDLTEYPKVTASTNNYSDTAIQLRVPDTTMLNKFIRAYKDKRIDSIKSLLYDALQYKVHELNLNRDEFSSSALATGQFTKGVVSLPYIAERAMYKNKAAWILEFTWGIDSCDIGHFRCFVMDAATADTLLYITCR
jgi:hypothetical protein